MQAFVPKNRKPKFNLTLTILDLSNIPLTIGSCSVKWHLPSSSAAEHRGRTEKARIQEHKASWDYSKDIPVRLTIDKNHSLQSCDIHFEIIQEYNQIKGGRVHLGNVKLNLAEYTRMPEQMIDEGQEEDGTITRKYLMQDSKVNSTLKISIAMKQIDGDTNFVAPPLKSAMVIGGIAGIINAEAEGADDMPSLAHKSRELSEAQDIYRRTLAATWACERGELPPDKLIEELFAGGDGGRPHDPVANRRSYHGRHPSRDESSHSSESGDRRTLMQSLLGPSASESRYRSGRHHNYEQHNGHSSVMGVSGRGSIEQQMEHSHHRRGNSDHDRHHHHHHSHSHAGQRRGERSSEVTEFDLRDNLKSWTVSAH